VVPGDFSSAAFIVAAGLCIPGSELTVTGAGVNATRTGLLDVLWSMGADVALSNPREQSGEPVADITVRASSLGAAVVEGDTVVRMIDEFPILAVIATQASGATLIRDAAELRVKESDRIGSVVDELRKLGASIEPRTDGFVVEGPTSLRGAVVDSHGDHRLGMALAIAGLVAKGETTVLGAERIADSFPGFVGTMRRLGAAIDERD
jgi:3-phosphoshikimate 1-carboxyvinyltransferase